MQVETVEVDKLRPFERNPKKHPESQLKKLRKSISEFGWTNPILATKDGMIVAGHARVEAAKQLNIGSVPVIYLDMPYEKAIAYVIADNRLAELAETDTGLLFELLGELSALPDFDIELTGFDIDELAAINPIKNTVVSEGTLPELTIETDIKTGDIIELGSHKLLCGNSKNKHEIIRLLDGTKADLLYYDPPYEIEELWGCYIDCNKALVFTDNRHVLSALPILSKFKYVYEFVWDTVISWYLNNRPLCRHRSAWLCQNEPDYDDLGAIVDDGKTRTAKKMKTNLGEHVYEPLTDGVRLTTIYQKNKAQLPAQYGKPLEWIGPIIAGCSAKNVLDLFGGSGSTLMACEQLNIPCFVVEIDPIKCQNIVNRFHQR